MKITFSARRMKSPVPVFGGNGGVRFLVDCGMFQGGREADERTGAFRSLIPRESILSCSPTRTSITPACCHG